MCKYCKDIMDPNSLEDVILIKDANIKVNNTSVGSLEVWMYGLDYDFEKSKPKLNAAIRVGDNYVRDVYFPIKYCPFCGEKLSRKDRVK